MRDENVRDIPVDFNIDGYRLGLRLFEMLIFLKNWLELSFKIGITANIQNL